MFSFLVMLSVVSDRSIKPSVPCSSKEDVQAAGFGDLSLLPAASLSEHVTMLSSQQGEWAQVVEGELGQHRRSVKTRK